MAEIKVEPKRMVWWPYFLGAIVLVAAIWLMVERNGSSNAGMSGRDSTTRDSVVSPPPR